MRLTGLLLFLGAYVPQYDGCPIVEWQQEMRNDWLCAGGCWEEEWCRHGCAHSMKWNIPRGYYVARAWLTAATYGDQQTVSGYKDYEMAEAHHDLEGIESYGERRYGGTRGGWFDETKNAREGDPEAVEGGRAAQEAVGTFVDGRRVGSSCEATEPRDWQAAESLWQDGFPAPRDYTSHTYTTPNKTLEKYETIPAVAASHGQYNQWSMCVDRIDITEQLKSRVGPEIEVIMATAHEPRGHPTREPDTMNAGRQAYGRGSYRFKARATLFLHLAPENSLKPYLGPAYGDTHIHIRPECLTSALTPGGDDQVFCLFGQQPEWQGGYGETGLADVNSTARGTRVNATVEADGTRINLTVLHIYTYALRSEC